MDTGGGAWRICSGLVWLLRDPGTQFRVSQNMTSFLERVLMILKSKLKMQVMPMSRGDVIRGGNR